MIKIDQTRIHDPENGVVGNCFIACIASLLEFPLKYIPEFEKHPRYASNDGDWWIMISEWLEHYGYEMMNCRADKPPKGYSIISGQTNRFNGKVLHSCIALDGKLVFDPHPSRSGLINVRDYITIEMLDGS